MLILEHAWGLQESCRPGGEHRSGITDAVGLQLSKGLVEFVIQALQVNFGVQAQDRLQVVHTKLAASVGLKPCFQLSNAYGGQTEAGRLGVTAVTVKQVSSLIESFDQVKPG